MKEGLQHCGIHAAAYSNCGFSLFLIFTGNEYTAEAHQLP